VNSAYHSQYWAHALTLRGSGGEWQAAPKGHDIPAQGNALGMEEGQWK